MATASYQLVRKYSPSLPFNSSYCSGFMLRAELRYPDGAKQATGTIVRSTDESDDVQRGSATFRSFDDAILWSDWPPSVRPRESMSFRSDRAVPLKV